MNRENAAGAILVIVFVLVVLVVYGLATQPDPRCIGAYVEMRTRHATQESGPAPSAATFMRARQRWAAEAEDSCR